MRAFLIIATMVLAGCSTPTESQPLEWREFEAHYEVAGGGNVHVTLTQGYSIADAQLTVRPVYKLAMELRGIDWMGIPDETDEPLVRTAYLDGEFRVVRLDHPCGLNARYPCQYADVAWNFWGALPPLGIGHPLILERNNHTLALQPAGLPIVEKGDPLTLAFNDSVHAPNRWMRLAGDQYTYDDSIAPVTMDHLWEPWGRQLATRTALEEGNVLDAIPAWPEPWSRPAAHRGDPNKIPGLDQILLSEVATTQEALDYLLDQEPQARAAMQKGCIGSVDLLPQKSYVRGAIPLLEINTSQYTFEFGNKDMPTTSWSVTASRRPTGMEWNYEREDYDWQRTDCAAISKRPPLKLTPAEFIATANTLPISGYDPSFSLRQWEPTSLVMSFADRLGLDVYWAAYSPDFWGGGTAAGMPYSVGHYANWDAWVAMTLHPDDVSALDAGKSM